jgi:hypothetical protein
VTTRSPKKFASEPHAEVEDALDRSDSTTVTREQTRPYERVEGERADVEARMRIAR